jgi:hypothetical protein
VSDISVATESAPIDSGSLYKIEHSDRRRELGRFTVPPARALPGTVLAVKNGFV